ncbi:hypothetical protein H8959_001894 [Pygathrix nigripes]
MTGAGGGRRGAGAAGQALPVLLRPFPPRPRPSSWQPSNKRPPPPRRGGQGCPVPVPPAPEDWGGAESGGTRIGGRKWPEWEGRRGVGCYLVSELGSCRKEGRRSPTDPRVTSTRPGGQEQPRVDEVPSRGSPCRGLQGGSGHVDP